MELFQTLITALTTPNEGLINVFGIFFTLIEMFVTMLLFTTILKITISKKQKIMFIIAVTIINLIVRSFVHGYIATIISIVAYILLVKLTFKITFSKSIIYLLLTLVVITCFETVFIRIYTVLFKISYQDISTIPIYRLSITLLIYLSFYLLYKLSKHFNLNISILDNMNRNMIIASIFGVLAIFVQLCLINFCNDSLPVLITISETICSIIYFFINMYSLSRTTKLEITTQNLEEAQLYNKSLKILHDNLRSFKHDFGNIIQGIGGYVETGDIKGFQTYYYQLLEDCQRVNNLSALSPDVINNPAVYSILATKYFKCDDLGIKINLDIFLDLNTLNCKIYEFTRILGILMDNAIEASYECDEKIINVEIRKDPSTNRQLLIIENTYANKDINIDDIFKKNYTSKPKHSGIGLWEVNQILNKNTNLALYTTKTNTFFNQQFEIYEK